MSQSASVPWVNWSGTQKFFPKRVERPTSLPELREIMLDVGARGGQVRPVATGLSFSDILQAEDTLLEVVGLLGQGDTGALLPLEDELWRLPRPAAPFVRIICGARIRQLNAVLAASGLAFANLGGYDGQTFIGAVSTSTHGSGYALGPLADGVVSLDLVAADGTLYRIEPNGGPTDPDKFAHRYGDSMKLRQSDDWFWSCVVSMGCMGIIHSVTVQVKRAYRLVERRHEKRWSEVAEELKGGGPFRRFRHYEVLINPYRRRDGDYSCLVSERSVAPPDVESIPLPPARDSAESLTFLASSQQAILRLMVGTPRLIPAILENGLGALATGPEGHIDESYRVFNVGKINTADVISAEYFFPTRGDRYIAAVGRLLEIVEQNSRRGIYQDTPLALRFVGPSKAPLSMTRDEPHCTVETAFFRLAPHGCEALMTYERACLELGGRPHWGQLNELTGQRDWLHKAYPGLCRWMAVRQQLDPKGLFNNHFTDRLGISTPMKRCP